MIGTHPVIRPRHQSCALHRRAAAADAVIILRHDGAGALWRSCSDGLDYGWSIRVDERDRGASRLVAELGVAGSRLAKHHHDLVTPAAFIHTEVHSSNLANACTSPLGVWHG